MRGLEQSQISFSYALDDPACAHFATFCTTLLLVSSYSSPIRQTSISHNIYTHKPNTTHQTQEKASRGGWVFDNADTSNAKYREPLFRLTDLHEIYTMLSPGYRGRCTAPALVDRKARKMVNTESSDIVRMLNALPPPPGKP